MTETLALAELRNLRRYAFCLLGNRFLSDMAVEAALHTLVSDVLTVSGRAISRLDLTTASPAAQDAAGLS